MYVRKNAFAAVQIWKKILISRSSNKQPVVRLAWLLILSVFNKETIPLLLAVIRLLRVFNLYIYIVSNELDFILIYKQSNLNKEEHFFTKYAKTFIIFSYLCKP